MARADSLRMRAGQIFCACDIDGLPLDLDTLPKDSSIVRMAFAFGASVLAQVLTLSALPLASASITLPLSHVPWPYLAMLLGAALAGFPAALLIDRMGRRSAFALGASLGIAGGILSAWAMMARLPQPFIIGVLWLGMAQGFGLFYRHAGAMAGGAGGLVFGAGSLGAIIGPFIIEAAQNIGGPLAPAYTLGVAGLAHLLTLALAVSLPARIIEIETRDVEIQRPPLGRFLSATLLAAMAWFGMTGLMAQAPLAMIGCGLSFSLSAVAMAVHLAAMYLPGFMIGRLIIRLGALNTAFLGVVLLGFGAMLLQFQGNLAGFSLSLAIAGFGWGTATIGSTAMMHRAGRPSVHALALHDISLFLAAMAGAALFGRLG